MLSYYMYKLNLYIGKLSDASSKHKSAILFLSVLVMFVGPDVKLTFGSASLAGLGISVSPPQELAIGHFLLALLTYRFIAFWVLVLLDGGTDISRAERKALLAFDPAWGAEEEQPGDKEQLIRRESGDIIYKWKVRQIAWEILFPTVIALLAFVTYITKFILFDA